MAVTETKVGARAKTEEQAEATSVAKAQIPAAESKVSPEEETRIYTQKQLDTFIQATRSEWGRKVSAAETERDQFKSQIGQKQSELEDIQAERDSLRQQIEDLSSDDPKKFNLIKMDKELRERERKLKADTVAFEAERGKHQATIKMANETLREINIWNIAAEYDNGNPEKLKDLCDSFEAREEESIRRIADTIWSMKGEEVEKDKGKGIKPYSGKSEGGAPGGKTLTAEDVKKMTPEERFRRSKEISESIPLGLR